MVDKDIVENLIVVDKDIVYQDIVDILIKVTWRILLSFWLLSCFSLISCGWGWSGGCGALA